MTKEERIARIEALSEEELMALFALLESLIESRPPSEAPAASENPDD